MSILHTGWTPSPTTTFEQELESIKKLLESDPNNPYWQSRYSSLMEKIYGKDWEQDAEAVHNLLHPVEEAYDLETSEDYKRFDQMARIDPDDLRSDLLGL